MLEPSAIYAIVREIHLPTLSDGQSRILALRVIGWKPPRIAERLFISDREARRRLDLLAELICLPAGVGRDPAVLGLWFTLHTACKYGCSAPALAMLENGADFWSEKTSENA